MEIDKATQELVVSADKISAVVSIETADQYANAANTLKTIKAHVKALDDKRKELVEPYIKGKAALDEFFKKPQEKYKQIIDKINSAMNEYQARERKKAEEEQRRIEAERQKELDRLAKQAEKARAKGDAFKADELEMKKEEVAERPMIVAQSNVPPVPMQCRENWKFEVIDEAKLPREFLTPDLVKIGKHVREQKAAAKIEGVKITVDYTNY